MVDTKKLTDVLNNLVQNNPEQAQAVFHDYLQNKIQELVKDTPDVENENTKE